MTKARLAALPPFVAVLVSLAGSCASKQANQPPQMEQLTRAITPPDRRGPPEPLSPQAKALLADRMSSHAEDMSDLVSAIVLLQYSRIITRAEQIADDVTLRSAPLPEMFFIRQDELKVAARALGEAARNGDPYQVAQAYGHVSQACVRCHADFRPGS